MRNAQTRARYIIYSHTSCIAILCLIHGDAIIHGRGIIVIHGFGADMLSPALVEVTTGSLQPLAIKADDYFAPVNNFQVVDCERLMFREQTVPERTSSTRVWVRQKV